MTKHTFKIGNNRGRARIWIDGNHLTNAGFTPGTKFFVSIKSGHLLLTVGTTTADAGHQNRKVSGRPDGKPIIDIVGKTVSETFPGATRIEAEFDAGRIIIRAAQ